MGWMTIVGGPYLFGISDSNHKFFNLPEADLANRTPWQDT